MGWAGEWIAGGPPLGFVGVRLAERAIQHQSPREACDANEGGVAGAWGWLARSFLRPSRAWLAVQLLCLGLNGGDVGTIWR